MFRLLFASLAYHWRTHLALACGVAAGTAVITGALLVGDSMRGSLRRLTLERLGRVDQALVADRFFRAQLCEELASEPGFPARAFAVPVVLLQVSVENAEGGDGAARANRVNLIGCDARFWELGQQKAAAGALDGDPNSVEAALRSDPRGIVLNQPLAEQLGVKAGDAVLVRLPNPGSIPADTPLGRKSETVRTQRLTVRQVIPARGFGRFSLTAEQQTRRNAYVPLAGIEEWLERPGEVNAILVAGAAESIQPLLKPRLEDYGVRVARTPRGYINITSERMLLEPEVERAVREAAQRDATAFSADAAKPEPALSLALTYLANTIACGTRETPYSTITAVDFVDRSPLGPMRTIDGKPAAPLGEGEIALNRWAAEDLGAKPGDTVRVTYFEPESSRGVVREKTATFRLAAILELAGAAADPDFTPEVPGVTDQLSIANWNPPFPFDARRVRAKDDAYWRVHRGTPKAFVSLAAGRKLWSSRFGRTTSIRVPLSDPAAVERVRSAIHIDPAAMGFAFRPVKAQGLAASAGTTPFEFLFLSFSFFLIVSAAMLVALLFRLGVDRRAAEIGTLLAVGWQRRQVTGLLVGEGLVVVAAGALAGTAVGIGYAALLVAGLHTLWLAAVVTPFMQLDVTWQSLAVGYASGLGVAMASITWSARNAGRGRPRRLMAGEIDTAYQRVGTRGRLAGRLACGALVAAVGLAATATLGSQEYQAAAFFGAAALVLCASLMWVWARLRAGATGPAVAAGRGNLMRLALRSAARNPMQSTLTIGLVAAASFLIVAVSAFRIDPAQEQPNRASANGGFTIVGQSDQPIYFDLNTPAGRDELGFSGEDSRTMQIASTIPLRVRPGDDASCLNLYRPRQPRILGVPKDLIQRGGFVWAAAEGPSGVSENPWKLLEEELQPDADGVPRVPVVLEKTTADYSLHLGGVGATYDVHDGSGRPIRLVIVGLLGPSLFQGDLLISEAAFVRHFPEQAGYRFFLIETPPDQAAEVQPLQRILERTLGDFGFWTQTASQRLAAFQAVENTYLSTFQSLGGLGLLLGTLGLGAVQLRSVLERRRELALLRATGFRRRSLAAMVVLENATLLAAGLVCGVLSAVVAVLPHFWTGAASIPWASLAATLGLVLAVGLLAGWAAVRSAVRTPLLATLRGE